MANNSVADMILNAVDYAIEKKMGNLKQNYVLTTIKATSASKKRYPYIVVINGSEYRVMNGLGVNFAVGDRVWVHIPDGDYSKAYICASATGKIYSSGGGGQADYDGSYERLTDADLAEICK